MKIAIILSGRIVHYDKCLIPLLEEYSKNIDISIDIFASINDTDNKKYYNIFREKLKKYLKGIYIKEYKIPEFIKNNHIHEYNYDGIERRKKNPEDIERIINNSLSMFYNDNNAFKMSIEYSKKYNFDYDLFFKFRADIYNTKFPKFEINNILNCVKPKSYFKTHGICKKMCISDCYAWGNKNIMSIYFNTYNYLIKKFNELNGDYWIAYEDTLTDNIYDNKINVKYYNIHYKVIQKSKQPQT